MNALKVRNKDRVEYGETKAPSNRVEKETRCE